PVNAAGHRSTVAVHGGDRRSTTVNAAGHRSTPADHGGASDVAPTSAPVNAAGHRSTAAVHGGDRRSKVAVNDGRRWRTTVDCRWTTVDHHRTIGQWWLVGWSTIGSGPGSGRVWIGSGPGPPRGMPRVSHVCPRGIHMAADVDNGTYMGVEPGTLSLDT
nr:hypothetical protein [Tanacetum cinerariifolium]